MSTRSVALRWAQTACIGGFAAILLLCGAAGSLAGDWPQFRGPAGNPVAVDPVPLAGSLEEQTIWRADLPGRGPSSPIVVGGRVVVTCSSGSRQDRLHVLCFDADSGRLLWQRQFWATGRTLTHPTSAVAAPTPASDGRFIYAFYSSNDLVCLDLDGRLRWYRGLAYDWPQAGNDTGMSSSPIVADGVVVVQVENQQESFACGIDAASGTTRWRIGRPRQSNWCSPTLLPGTAARPPLVLLQSPNLLTAHDLHSGQELWRMEDQFGNIPSPLAVADRVFVASNGVKALAFPPDSAAPQLLWSEPRMRPGAPSPVLAGDRLLVLSNDILTCGDAETGEVLWKLRLPGARHWATPVVAGQTVYCVNQDGTLRAIELDSGRPRIAATLELGETIQGTPAAAGGALYMRSDRHLWKIGGATSAR